MRSPGLQPRTGRAALVAGMVRALMVTVVLTGLTLAVRPGI